MCSSDLLPRPARQAVVMLSVVLSVGLLIASAWLAWGAVAVLYRNGLTSYALRIPMWYYQAAVPFAFLLIARRFVQHAIEELRQAGADHG